MLAICAADMPVVFKAPKTSSKAESVSQGTKPGAKSGHKKLLTSSKQPSVSSREETKGGSSKVPTSPRTGHSKKRKESSSAMDSNPSQPPISTLVDTGMHKEDQKATSGPTSLRVTSEARANPQLSSGYDASAVSTAETDLGISAPSDFIPQQQDKTKSISDGLEIVLTTPEIGTSNAAKTSKEIKFRAIKLEDLEKLVPNVKVDFKDLDFPEDDPIIVVDDSEEDEEEDKNEEIHSITNDETEDISASTPPSPRHYFSNSLPTKLKDLPSKFNELTEETVTNLTSQVAELKTLQWELPAEFISLSVQVASVQAKLKTMDALPGLLLNVTKALNKFAQVFDSASSKAGEQGVPSPGQADTMPAEGEKNINQATISQLFQRRSEKNAKGKT
ncbi:hypothetical protein Tco_0400935 [Tanacetum coccineum]